MGPHIRFDHALNIQTVNNERLNLLVSDHFPAGTFAFIVLIDAAVLINENQLFLF